MYSRLRREVGIALAVLLAPPSWPCSFFRLQQVISQPILQLSQTARAVSERKDYSLRAQRQNQDEVGTLIVSFNEMLAQIKSADTELQEARIPPTAPTRPKVVSSPYEHELRTPLTTNHWI